MSDGTYWLCSDCGLNGYVTYPEGSSIYVVIETLERAHNRRSPACEFDLSRIRLSRDAIDAAAQRIRRKAT